MSPRSIASRIVKHRSWPAGKDHVARELRIDRIEHSLHLARVGDIHQRPNAPSAGALADAAQCLETSEMRTDG